MFRNDTITDLWCADTSISSSDKRDKTDVEDFNHGLDWITQLKPITYRWDKRSWYNDYDETGELISEKTPDGSKKRAKKHLGFLAQDELEIEKQFGYGDNRANMLVASLTTDESSYGLKYERLVPILVNAVKELSAKVKALEDA